MIEATMTIADFEANQRVELHPATDLWMRGARYGQVQAVGRKLVSVKLDATNQTVKLAPRNIGRIVATADGRPW